MSRSTTKWPVKEVSVHQGQGPKRRRSAITLLLQLDGDACKEAISFLVHSPDEASARKQTSTAYKWETCPLSSVEYGPLKSFDVDSEENSEMDLPRLACCWDWVQSRIGHLLWSWTWDACDFFRINASSLPLLTCFSVVAVAWQQCGCRGSPLVWCCGLLGLAWQPNIVITVLVYYSLHPRKWSAIFSLLACALTCMLVTQPPFISVRLISGIRSVCCLPFQFWLVSQLPAD